MEIRRVIVLVNPHSGSADAAEQVRAAMEIAGLKADARVVTPGELPKAAAAAAGERPDALIACGGDGTISTIAAAVAGSDIPLGVIPAGTLNHFARDLGLSTDLFEAARIIAWGNTRQIDLGAVNGHQFLNNSSIGLYPLLVQHRERQRRWFGRAKWSAMLVAVLWVFRRFPMVHVTLEAAGQTVRCKTPLVFVGNNRYAIDFWNLGRRDRLDTGELSVYLVNASTRLRLLRLAARILLGRLQQDRDFVSMSVTSLRIEAKRKSLHVALDGEVCKLQPPLTYRILPRALNVLAPA